MTSERYPIFIAYHGSGTATGTEQIALSFRDYITQKLSVKAYCGPSTDEHDFSQHTNVVIPSSDTFLLVVNDAIPTDSFGRLDKTKSRYLYGEIYTFCTLISKQQRSKKDFAVAYVGNAKKDEAEIMMFVKNLLSSIDPAGYLANGNQYYLTSFSTLDRWIRERIAYRYNQQSMIVKKPEPVQAKQQPAKVISTKKIDANVIAYIAFFIISTVLIVMSFVIKDAIEYVFGAFFLFASLSVFPYYCFSSNLGGVKKAVKIILGIVGILVFIAATSLDVSVVTNGGWVTKVERMEGGTAAFTFSFVFGAAAYFPGFLFGFSYEKRPSYYMLITLTSFFLFPIYFIMGIVGLTHLPGRKSHKDYYE